MRRMALAAVLAIAATSAQASYCDDMVTKFDAFLKTHPDATGALKQTVGAQLTHQPTRESVEKAKKEGRQHLVDLLAKAKSQQAAGDEKGCRATLSEVEWMIVP